MRNSTKSVLIILLLLFLNLFISACSTVKPAEVYNFSSTPVFKSVYVVLNENVHKEHPMHLYIQQSLAKHGLPTSCGLISEKPNDVEVYLTYNEKWDFDLIEYLSKLNINLFDNKTNSMIASGQFVNGFLHSFPDPEKKAQEVVDSIVNKARRNIK